MSLKYTLRNRTRFMEFTAETIAEFIDGEVIGDKNTIVNTIAKIEEGTNGALAFLSNMKYEHYIYDTHASIVIVDKSFSPKQNITTTLIKVENAYQSFSLILKLYSESKQKKTGISTNCHIADDASIGEDCYIGSFVAIDTKSKIGNNCCIYPNCYIGDNVTIGSNVIIYSGVNIYKDCVIGNDVIIHSGAVIGADGFGFAPNESGSFDKIPQIGNVIIEDYVEIGANTAIDRATMGSTIIKKGTKLDNLIQIGHNVVFGENCVAAAQIGVAGSTKIGDNCMFGGQVGVAGHITVASHTQVGSQSGISNTVKEPNQKILGTPAKNARQMAKSYALLRNLPEMSKEILSLKKEIAALNIK